MCNSARKESKMSKRRIHDYEIKGCIYKKQTSPYYYAEINYTQTDGRAKRLCRTTKCKRKYDAVRRMDEIIRELENELLSGQKDSWDFVAFMEHWLENVEAKEIQASTLSTYQRHLNAYIRPFFQPMGLSLGELRPPDLWDFVEYMQELTTQNGMPIKTVSIKKVLSNIKLALDYAVKKGIIEINAADAVKLKTKRTEKYEHTFYTVDQLMQLWQVAKGTLLEVAIVLTSIYGLRRGEVCGLIWDRVDFVCQTIRIEETIVYAGSKPYIKGTKTEASMRTMPIISPIRSYLNKIKKKQQENTDRMGSAWVGSGYVVVDDFGAPIRPVRITNNFKRLLKNNNLPHIRFHDLRHSVATYMLSMGVPIAQISAWLGHKSVTTTANIYAHVTDQMRKDTARWLDADYNSNGHGGADKMMLEKAILKLFEIVLDEDEIGRIKQKAIGSQNKKESRYRSFDQSANTGKQEQNGNQDEEKVQLRVIRGKLA